MDLGLAQRLGLLALAGALGTLARYGVSLVVVVESAGRFPVATLVINTMGCLAFGIIWAMSDQQGRIPESVKWLLLTGFMGAFTTFSTFAFETGRLMADGRPGMAAGYVLASNLLGVGAFALGWWGVSVIGAARA